MIFLESGKSPIFEPIYQLSKRELIVFKKYININLIKKFIQLLIFPIANLFLFILKKNRKLRFYIDY